MDGPAPRAPAPYATAASDGSLPSLRVLVTGATGFVGSFVTAELLSRGQHVACLVRAGNAIEARQRMESCENQVTPEPAEQHRMLHKLVNVDMVDQFLHSKFLGAKRFSVAGAESVITTLVCLIDTAAVGQVSSLHRSPPQGPDRRSVLLRGAAT